MMMKIMITVMMIDDALVIKLPHVHSWKVFLSIRKLETTKKCVTYELQD